MKKKVCVSLCLLSAFALWTAAVVNVDVQPIGPLASGVGFAALNGCIHRWTGVHMTLYTITDWLGLVPVATAFLFAMMGLKQWICRKNILKVDWSILMLGGFYLVVLAAYLFFEEHVVNYRPVLIEGILEASYPSSTTLLVMCVMPTAAMQARARIKHAAIRRVVTSLLTAFTIFMVAGRLISGVHWLSDIIGGALLSLGLIALYAAACDGGRK